MKEMSLSSIENFVHGKSEFESQSKICPPKPELEFSRKLCKPKSEHVLYGKVYSRESVFCYTGHSFDLNRGYCILKPVFSYKGKSL